MPITDIAHQPHVLSDEEIEMYLKGDRREIDRLMLYSINRLTAVIVPHAHREDARDKEFDTAMKAIGGVQAIIDRARFVNSLIETQPEHDKRDAFIDSLIRANEDRAAMMQKVAQSSLTWALLAFFGFLAAATWHEIVSATKKALGL